MRPPASGTPAPACHPPTPVHARTTRSLITALLRTRQPKVLAEGIREANARLDAQRMRLAVHGKNRRSSLRPAFRYRQYNIGTHHDIPSACPAAPRVRPPVHRILEDHARVGGARPESADAASPGPRPDSRSRSDHAKTAVSWRGPAGAGSIVGASGTQGCRSWPGVEGNWSRRSRQRNR